MSRFTLSIRLKIYLGFLIILVLLGMVGGLAYTALQGSSAGFTEYRTMAKETILASRVQAYALMMNLSAKNYVEYGKQEYYDAFISRTNSLRSSLAEAMSTVTNTERSEMLDEINQHLQQYDTAFQQIVDLMNQRSALELKMVEWGPPLDDNIMAIMNVSQEMFDLATIIDASTMLRDLMLARLYTSRFNDSGDPAFGVKATEAIGALGEKLGELKQQESDPTIVASLDALIELQANYAETLEQTIAIALERDAIMAQQVEVHGPRIADLAEEITLSITAEQDALGPKLQASNADAITRMSLAGGIALVLGLLMAFFLARAVYRPLQKAVRYAEAVAAGDFAASLDVKGSDEIGHLAQAMRSIPATLTAMKDEFDRVVDEISMGRLMTRGQEEHFQGQYAELIDGVNKLADRLVNFWDAVPTPIMAIDRQFNVLYMNEAGRNATETLGEDLSSRACHSLFRTGDCNTDRCACARAMRDETDATSDTTAKPIVGEMEIHYTATPIRNAAGEVVGAFEIVTDQTAIKRAQAKMLRVARQATDISERMASASEELAAQVEQISQGAEMQSSRMAETATAMDQMNASVLEVARNSGDASSNAERTRTRADEGAEIVAQSVQAIEQVQAATGELGRNMQKLAEQAETIGSVMNVITDIADQTNLLALNAAIEAARAGDAGRGFAVVADEVRKLAEKTMSATGEVGRSIQAIQQATRENMQGMDRAAEAVGRATTLVQDSGKALREIVEFMGVNARQVEGIATAAEEQSATSEQINRAVEEVNRIVAETTDGMRQSSQAVQELAVMSGELSELIAELQA